MSEGEGEIRVEGARQMRRALKAAGDGLDELKDAHQEAARIVLAEADQRVPRRSGALAATGRVNRAASKASILYGNAKVPYAPPIHWGSPSKHIKAHPWVIDAAVATEDRWVQAYTTAVEQLMDKVERTV